VGKTVQKLCTRVSQHKAATASTRAVRDAFCKHGDAMRVSVLMRCKEEDLDMNESLYIEMLDTVHPRGYNLRCGRMAAMPRTNEELSTHVHAPVMYDSEEDCRSVAAAVAEDVRNICSNAGVKPWAGVVKKSVAEVNKVRGAKQFSAWAGPRKTKATNATDDPFGFMKSTPFKPPDDTTFDDWVKGLDQMHKAKQKVQTDADVAESLAREGRAGHQARMDEIDYQEKMQISNGRKFVEAQKFTREHLIGKIKDAESVGMHDKAAALKRKLSDMLDA